jgi:fructose-bisphosphate aldolase class II
MAANPSEFDPRKFFKDATAAARDICLLRFEAFGSAGQAARIQVVPLERMAGRYRQGELGA